MPAIGNFAPEVDVPTKSVFDAPRLILLLNTIQIIGNSENACSHDDFRALLRPVGSPSLKRA